MSNELAVAMAGLWSNLHMLRIMSNRGLVSPNEVESVYSSIVEALEGVADQEYAAQFIAKLDPQIAEIRKYAAERWIGHGRSNPS